MITVHCELKDNKLYSVVDEAFVNNARMKKVSKGNYEGDSSTFSTSYMSIRELFDYKVLWTTLSNSLETVEMETAKAI